MRPTFRLYTLLLGLLLAACGVPDQAALLTTTPPPSTTPAPPQETAVIAPIEQPTKPQPVSTSVVAESPAAQPLSLLDQALFQPGDLPPDVVAEPIDREIPEWTVDKVIPPEGYAQQQFTQADHPDGYGRITMYLSATEEGVEAAYGWLGGWGGAIDEGVPQPGIGRKAVLIMPGEDLGDITLAFTLCQAAVEIMLLAPVDQQVLLSYGARVSRRLDAVLCQGADRLPILTPPVPVPTATPYPTAPIGQTVEATLTRFSPQSEALHSYTFADPQHGWLAVGASIFATADGGATWYEQQRMSRQISYLKFRSTQFGWAVTQAGIFETQDGGVSWQPVAAIPDDGQQRVPPPKTVSYSDTRSYEFCSHEGWSAGNFSSIGPQTAWATCSASPGTRWVPAELWRTDDGGQHWQLIADTIAMDGETVFSGELPMGQGIGSLQFLDEQHGWLITSGTLYTTNDGGHTWTELNIAINLDDRVMQPHFLTPSLGFVVVSRYDDREHERLLRTDDGGQTWREIFVAQRNMPEPTGPIHFFDDETGVGLGRLERPNVFLRTENAGSTWAEVSTLPVICPSDSYRSALSFPDTQHGWAMFVCPEQPQPTLWRTADGGATWTALPALPPSLNQPAALSFVDAQTGYVADTEGHLFATTDGGLTFTARSSAPALTQLTFIMPDIGWAVSDHQLFATNDAGRSWSHVPLGYRVRAFDLLPTGEAWVVTSDFSSQEDGYTNRLLMTRDSGRSWTRYVLSDVIPDLGYEAWRGQIQFVDSMHGWIATHSLHATADGGQSWTQLR